MWVIVLISPKLHGQFSSSKEFFKCLPCKGMCSGMLCSKEILPQPNLVLSA